MIKNMGNAGRNGGEYYTPRPLIRAMIQVLAPKIGERIYDGTCGSAGFLCEAFDYLSKQPGLTTSDQKALQTRTFYGKEKKSLAADITYIRTRSGWLYLAAVLDLHSRKIIGWAMAQVAQRSSIGGALRYQPYSGIVWQGSSPPAQSWRRSPGQQRVVDDCNGSHEK